MTRWFPLWNAFITTITVIVIVAVRHVLSYISQKKSAVHCNIGRSQLHLTSSDQNNEGSSHRACEGKELTPRGF